MGRWVVQATYGVAVRGLLLVVMVVEPVRQPRALALQTAERPDA